MNPTRIRVLFFGQDWDSLANAIFWSIFGTLAIGIGISLFPELRFLFLLFVLFPASIWFGFVNGGLVSAWLLIFPPVSAAWPSCISSGDVAVLCAPPPSLFEKVQWGLLVALVVGTAGYMLGRSLALADEAEPRI